MKTKIAQLLLVAGMAAVFAGQSRAATIQITIQNTSKEDGIWIMRPWIGLHDGNFQTFTVGQPASSGLQHIAEDGISGDTTAPSLLSGPPNVCAGDPSVYNANNPCQYQIFNNYAGGSQQATIGGPTIPSATLVKTFTVDPHDPNSQYLSFIVMLVPSNDAFFGTDSAHPIRLYDVNGHFKGGHDGIRIKVKRNDILDAGTEVNTGNQTDTAFLGQTIPGTGTHPDTDPVVHRHDRFVPNIVDGSNIFPGSQLNVFDEANKGGDIAEVIITELP